ncbi:MAG: cytochrome P450 [Solirubrobacterales bacterium]
MSVALDSEHAAQGSGPIGAAEAAELPTPPPIPLPPLVQLLRFRQRQIEFVFRARRELGARFSMRTGETVAGAMTGDPEDVRSLLAAKPELAPSTAGESPLRPILGPDSVLTATGERHLRRRKLLLPHFHGEAIGRYTAAIEEAAEREIDTWPLGRPFPLAPRMQAITLDVIMAGIFGIGARPARGTAEHRLRTVTRRLAQFTTTPAGQAIEMLNARRHEPAAPARPILAMLYRPIDELVAQRRRAEDLGERRDILSLLLQARTEEGEELSDAEIRAELLTLILAGHETTANSLAWAWERLTRAPAAHQRLLDAVRTDTEVEAVVEQTIYEAMRSRPVVPLTGRRVSVPWRLGPYAVPAGTGVLVSILLVHHHEGLYPEPFEFRPERWADRRPGTYEWLPFGGGIRRCLGASLALAEMRVVLAAMARRLDLACAEAAAEPALHRNVTMVPRHGARVVIRSRR